MESLEYNTIIGSFKTIKNINNKCSRIENKILNKEAICCKPYLVIITQRSHISLGRLM